MMLVEKSRSISLKNSLWMVTLNVPKKSIFECKDDLVIKLGLRLTALVEAP